MGKRAEDSGANWGNWANCGNWANWGEENLGDSGKFIGEAVKCDFNIGEPDGRLAKH